ncbi:MAG: uroporphyrinogen decarboxylase, partial [Deferribacteraceae bacterium]|jgi:uroporphyrinogen decarboxylase|nr:uroporphyrinogen decarboxylase [Deferribacteraceae bacterium]
MADELLDKNFVLQGNLDPAILLTTPDAVIRAADNILAMGAILPRGHIFNLGHGVLPATPVENIKTLVQHIHGG